MTIGRSGSHGPIDRWIADVDALLEAPEGLCEVLPKLYARIPKERDLKLDIRHGWVFDAEFVQLVDYEPRSLSHGAGLVMRRDLVPEVIEGLRGLTGRFAGGSRPGPDQGRLF